MKGLACPKCGHTIQVPTLGSEWVLKSDPTEGCVITGLTENYDSMLVQKTRRGVFAVRYSAEETRLQLSTFTDLYELIS